jgi:GT2 family glycosyltransferase
MKKLSIQLLVFDDNERKYFPFLFDSLKKQSFQDFELLLIDNSNGEEVIKDVEERAKEAGFEYSIINMKGNVGFTQAHNEAFRLAKGEYVLLLNPDMVLETNVLEKMIEFMDEQKDVASLAPRIMQWNFSKVKNTAEEGFTNKIDALGVRLLRNRRALEWLSGFIWEEKGTDPEVSKIYDKKILEVFGVSGAFAILRKSVIEKLYLPGDNLFDPTYHSYKEDLDLAYRLRNAGYTSYVLLDLVCYHDRTAASPQKTHSWAAIKNKKRQSYYVRFHSYKNHLRTLYKNEYWQNCLKDFPYIFIFEMKKFVYLLFFSPLVLFGGIKEILQNLSYTRKAKKVVHKTRKMYWKGLRRWFEV